MKFYQLRNLDELSQASLLSKHQRHALEVVANVLPFRVNEYVASELIDWSKIPEDPIYQLTFMQKGMLSPEQFRDMDRALRTNDSKEIRATADKIRMQLNPHPAGQLTSNVPYMNNSKDEVVPGVQHKYRETCLVFPSAGQTCFSYCTFCFRWPQFVGMSDVKFSTDRTNKHLDYIRTEKRLTDILFTGGDPLIMKAKKLASYIEPLLGEGFEHIQTIRIGTKALGYWPYRFTTDPDAKELLEIFEKVAASGKHLAFMAHFNHPRELETKALEEAVQNIRNTGAEIRSQSPVLKHINDDSDTWVQMWNKQVRLGIVPYYMFVERDTGPRGYFEIPLVTALDIYRGAIQRVSGLARTARGPSMSAHPGKVCVEGVTEIMGEKVIALSFLQGRNPDWVKRPFFAEYDDQAVWLNDLKPAFGEQKFFFETLTKRYDQQGRGRKLVRPQREQPGLA